MRIVGGRHGGRRLKPIAPGVRPTADRVREALFAMLESGRLSDGRSPIAGAVALDAFAGSGALGLEALSRGATRAIFLDSDRQSLTLARENATLLGETARCRFVARDATRPGPASEVATLAFLDPPYGQDLLAPALVALAAKGWFAPDALVIAEVGVRDPFAPPGGFDRLEARTYGAARLEILRHRAGGPSGPAPAP